MLTLEHLKAILYYDPETGHFTWLIDRRGSAKRGDRAGSYNNEGYIKIKINGETHRANRLAWFYMTGKWPENQVDHENRVRDDNRWENLKDLTHLENQTNRSFSDFKLKSRIVCNNSGAIIELKIGPFCNIAAAKAMLEKLINQIV